MTRRLICVLAALTVFSVAGCASSGKKAGPGVNVIRSVEVMDNAVELRMEREFSSSYTVYKPADPFTVVVEMPDVSRGKIDEKIVPDKKGITEIRFIETQTPVQMLRLELVLETPANIEPQKMGTSLLLSVVGRGEPAPEGEAPEEAAASVPLEELPPASTITNLAFAYSKGKLRFAVKSDGIMEPEIFTLEGRIIIDVPGVTMKATVPDTVVSPVKAVRYGIYDDKVRLVLDIEEEVDFAASTVGDSIVISIPVIERVVTAGEEKKAAEGEAVEGEAPLTAEEEFEKEEPLRPTYTGKPISLDFQDADIVPIFRFLGDIAGYNVVIHPDVKGKITLKLLNVPWDQALDIILEISNLDKSFEDNILRIAPLEVFARQKEEVARLRQIRETAAELVQKAIRLRYIDAKDMDARLKEAKALSPRGATRIDERTNTLIINDIKDNILMILDEEIPYWDTPEHGVMQVMIEARMIEVGTEYLRNLGIRWGGNATQDNFSFINDASTLDFSVNTPVGTAGPGTVGPEYFVQGGMINIGYAETFEVSLSLEALESISKVKQLANPRVLTIDKQAAIIRQGTQIPYTTVSAEGTETEFREAELKLEVTPEIQPNGILKLKVFATNNTPVPLGNALGIDTQEINTQALVKDGQTLVLGGIYQNTETELDMSVPWFSKIPFLGWLFNVSERQARPKELLIFITPRIVK